jgi:hypothetical protein
LFLFQWQLSYSGGSHLRLSLARNSDAYPVQYESVRKYTTRISGCIHTYVLSHDKYETSSELDSKLVLASGQYASNTDIPTLPFQNGSLNVCVTCQGWWRHLSHRPHLYPARTLNRQAFTLTSLFSKVFRTFYYKETTNLYFKASTDVHYKTKATE